MTDSLPSPLRPRAPTSMPMSMTMSSAGNSPCPTRVEQRCAACTFIAPKSAFNFRSSPRAKPSKSAACTSAMRSSRGEGGNDPSRAGRNARRLQKSGVRGHLRVLAVVIFFDVLGADAFFAIAGIAAKPQRFDRKRSGIRGPRSGALVRLC